MVRMTLIAACLAVVAGFTSAAPAQDLTRRPGPQSKPVCIINGTVHPVTGAPIVGGYVYIVGGVIQAVGAEPLPRFAEAPEFVDAKGKQVYPGLVAAYTQLGLTEIAAVRQSNDMNETGDVTPEVFGAVSVNPDSTLFPVTRLNGVLSAGVFPTGGLIAGRASVIQLEGWTWEDMTLRREAGLVVAWPFMRVVRAWWNDTPEEQQIKQMKESLARVRTVFTTAKSYMALKASDASTPTDIRWEAMRNYLPEVGAKVEDGKSPKGKLPVFIEANEYDQIVAAVDFAREMGLKIVIVGGRDAAMCADLLKKDDVPVIVQGTHRMPRRDDAPYDDAYTLPKRLHDAGVRFCISSGEETPHERNLPYAAAMAVAHGLDNESGLKSVTLWPAQILGLGDVLGSIEVGKAGTVIITDGDPLEVTTQVEAAFIQGKKIPMTSKQTDLAEKYREKYVQQKAGK